MSRDLDDPEFGSELQGLMDARRFDEFFQKVYEALTEDIEDCASRILANPARVGFKLNQVETLIRRFEKEEQFEKCAKLKALKDCVESSNLRNGNK